MSWTTTVIAICLLLLALMVWKEVSRNNRSRLLSRMLASILAAIALACIALPISYTAKTTISNSEGVLLTPGFNKDSLAAYQNNKLYTTDAAITKANPKFKITSVANLSDFASGVINISKLHILGYGLSENDLRRLKHLPLKFHPEKLNQGIVAINWNKSLKSGESLIVQGSLTGAKPNTIIILKGLNTTLDSIIINKSSYQNSGNSANPGNSYSDAFQLTSIPKNTGKATYNIIVLNGKDTLEKETIPFEVEPAKPLKVLMIAASPDFEHKFLKNWLVQQGYTLAVRTAISKEKYSREYFNMVQTPIDQLTPALLDKFDVLIGDLSAYALLSSAENSAIQQQMAQKGLGVVIKADSLAKGNTFLANTFPLDRLSDKTQKTSALSIEGQTAPTAKLNLDPVFIKYQNNTQPLVTDEQKHIVASSTIYGSGKIVFSVLSNTYNWALAGNQINYTTLWSGLISKAARKSNSLQQWSASPNFAMVNEPVTLTIEGVFTIPLQVKADNSILAFIQNALLPFSFSATYWPEKTGWQQVTQNDAKVFNWYTFAPDEWVTLKAAEKVKETQRYLRLNKAKINVATAEKKVVNVPVSKIYFYILLLLSYTYLWVERKL